MQIVADYSTDLNAPTGATHCNSRRLPLPRIYFEITEEEKKELEGKAESFGLPLARYARNLFFDRLKQDSKDSLTEILSAIRSLVPTLAEALGRLQKAPPEVRETFSKTLLQKWEEERGKA